MQNPLPFERRELACRPVARGLQELLHSAAHNAVIEEGGTLGAEASGGALLDGFTVSGLDAASLLVGLYTVQVIDEAGGTEAVEISVARTVRLP